MYLTFRSYLALIQYYRIHQVDTISSRDLGRYLKSVPFPEHPNALEALRTTFGSMTSFLKKRTRDFRVKDHPQGPLEGFLVYCNRKVGRLGEMDQPVEGAGDGYTGSDDNNGESESEIGDSDGSTDGDSDSDAGASSLSTPADTPVATTVVADADLTMVVKKYKVPELRAHLEQRGLSTTGKKDELVTRLVEAIEKETM